MKKAKFGFTLAEILIVMSIIGLVAEATIPVLVQKFDERVTVIRVKKAYSMLSQAYSLATIENGSASEWGSGSEGQAYPDDDYAFNVMSKLLPHLKTIKTCRGKEKGCYPPVMYKTLSGKNWTHFDNNVALAKAQLADGTLIAYYDYGDECKREVGPSEISKTVCGSIEIDTNGWSGPNVYGRDCFPFFLTSKGILPVGAKGDDYLESGFEDNCQGEDKPGGACTAWVIENENLDYIKCDGLSWDGKRSCDE